ncbi:protein unzipped-like [Daphnia pulicaria]|jgi:hypothetical protein|uniref:protein unzipped-like n=1 Tax=Daphnia pulicaria TaxID=35523 RepID=UPI001EEC6FB0|nr:protein unzipped-like [Daphnia pulicaria]XP_046656451.1 protein unzipped-like [Daphnia pulicaria]
MGVKWTAGLAVVALLLGAVQANNGVLIKSKSGQPLTSSTLHWVAVTAGRMPEDAVEGGQGTYVCRFQHVGRLEIGATDEEESSSCRIVYYGNIIIRDKFEVLVNVQQAGRLVWTKWDRSLTSFVGAVQVGEQYVGRVKTADGYRLGHLDPTVQRGRMFTIDQVEDQVVESSEGEILTEIEAIDYELGPIQVARNRRKMQSQEEVRLAHTILDNMTEDGPEEETNVASTLSYVVAHSAYLSHVRGMIKGLPASVHLGGEPTGGTVYFRWGDSAISGSFPQLMDVSHRLERGTAVNVSLTARRITFDAPFTTRLSITYSDQFVGKRQIDGQSRQTSLEDIRLHYGDVYYLSNGSLVPSTTTSTAVPPSSTTTTETTTSTTMPMASTTDSQPSSSVTSPPSLKQTKETLELKSRNVSSSPNSSSSIQPVPAGLFSSFLLSLLILIVAR